MNLSKAWFSPLSIFRTEALAPMLERQLLVIQSSQDLVMRAQSKGTQFWWERGMDAFFASRKHLEAAWAS